MFVTLGFMQSAIVKTSEDLLKNDLYSSLCLQNGVYLSVCVCVCVCESQYVSVYTVACAYIYVCVCVRVIFWPFDPAKNAIPGDAPEGGRHILMAAMRGNRVGGNWLMKWDELKKFPWYTHRLMHRKRVTSELHHSYFRLMTIKHSLSKIEWASNDYITELEFECLLSCRELEL